MDGDNRMKFLAEERERAWAAERDVIERAPLSDFSIGEVRGAFDAGWDYGAITLEREMSARIGSLESKLAMAIADRCVAEAMMPRWVPVAQKIALDIQGWFAVDDQKCGDSERQWLMVPPIPFPRESA